MKEIFVVLYNTLKIYLAVHLHLYHSLRQFFCISNISITDVYAIFRFISLKLNMQI